MTTYLMCDANADAGASVGFYDPNWLRSGAVIDLDYTNNIYYYNGAYYRSVDDIISAGHGDYVGGYARLILPSPLPSVWSLAGSGVGSGAAAAQYLVCLDDGDDGVVGDEIVYFGRDASSSYNLSVNTGNATVVPQIVGTITAGSRVSFAARVGVGGAVYCNGAGYLYNNVSYSGLTRLVIGNRSDAARGWTGTFDRITIFNVSLSNAQISALSV